jgi:hypothetical protein
MEVNKMNGMIIGLVGLLNGCGPKADVVVPYINPLETSDFIATHDARISHATPDAQMGRPLEADGKRNPQFSTHGYIGASVALVGEGDDRTPVAHPDRYVVGFDFSELDGRVVKEAILYVQSEGGVCQSSKDKKICGRTLQAEAYAITQPFDEETVTWNTQPSVGTMPIGDTWIQRDYDAEGTQGTHTLELYGLQDALDQGPVYGVMIRANDIGELDLHNQDAIWYNQADVRLGSLHSGSPVALVVSHTEDRN